MSQTICPLSARDTAGLCSVFTGNAFKRTQDSSDSSRIPPRSELHATRCSRGSSDPPRISPRNEPGRNVDGVISEASTMRVKGGKKTDAAEDHVRTESKSNRGVHFNETFGSDEFNVELNSRPHASDAQESALVMTFMNLPPSTPTAFEWKKTGAMLATPRLPVCAPRSPVCATTPRMMPVAAALPDPDKFGDKIEMRDCEST